MNNFETFNDLLQGMENKGRVFEGFCCWFISRVPDFAAEVTSVWPWEDWPDRWGPDCGIDLVVKTKTGKYWAVQCKCYSDQNTITKQDLDSFLSESNRRVFEKRLLLSTTDGIGINALRTCEGQEKEITLYLKEDFLSSALDFPGTLEAIKSISNSGLRNPNVVNIRSIQNVSNDLGIGFLKWKRSYKFELDKNEKDLLKIWENIKNETWWKRIKSINIPEGFSPAVFEQKLEAHWGPKGTPAHYAAKNSNLAVMKTLIEFGVNIHLRDNTRGYSLVDLASLNKKNPDVLQYLLQIGCVKNQDIGIYVRYQGDPYKEFGF